MLTPPIDEGKLLIDVYFGKLKVIFRRGAVSDPPIAVNLRIFTVKTISYRRYSHLPTVTVCAASG